MARKGRNAAMMRAFSILENCIGSMQAALCKRRASLGTCIGYSPSACAPSSVWGAIWATRVRPLSAPYASWKALGRSSASRACTRPTPRDLLDQPIFTNAALELETDLLPGDLLSHLKRLEIALGREPSAERFSARTVDLDILAFDGLCVADMDLDLIVPHPRLQERRFVLEPLAELDPGLRPWRNCADLRTDVTVADLLPSVADQEVMRIGGPDWADR